MSENSPRFPLFVSLKGKDVLIVGGGKIAARRAGVLLSFGAAVTVVSPELCEAMRSLDIYWKQERYSGLDKQYALVAAATNDRAVNREIGEDAKAAGVLCSVADSKDESTFWFPAIARGGGLVAGMISETGGHAAVKKAAERIRKCLEES